MKRIKKGIISELKKDPVFSIKIFKAILPIFLYLVFGISNVIFLTWSMHNIPPSIVYAIWTGIVIASAAIIDQILSKIPLKSSKILFILMILIGILGLRLKNP